MKYIAETWYNTKSVDLETFINEALKNGLWNDDGRFKVLKVESVTISETETTSERTGHSQMRILSAVIIFKVEPE